MTVPRLRQSYAKDLLRCPALVKRQLDAEARRVPRKQPTKAMELGTLVDRLVLGGDDWTLVSGLMGPKGAFVPTNWRTKAAKQEAANIRKAGKVPVLQHEYDRALVIADSAIRLFEEHGVDVGECETQKEIEWTGPHGVACSGTPDLIRHVNGSRVDLMTIDLKVGAAFSVEDLERQAFAMGWDIQGAAYTEAVDAAYHVIVHVETTTGLNQATWNPLSEDFLAVGRARWEAAAAVWKECLETGEWPGARGEELQPPRWAAKKWLDDEEDLSGLGLEE